MRKLILFGLLAVMILPARASERITVEQLEQRLDQFAASHRPYKDREGQLSQASSLAFQMSRLELSERLTASTLERLTAKYKLGVQPQRTLELLADRSALFDPPEREWPDRPAPDAETQKRMVTAARAYVFQILTRLPNFFATRTTSRFAGTKSEYAGLHPAGGSTREITFRDGRELINPMQVTRPPQTLPDSGLESRGEFGPEPAVVLIDLRGGTIAFHHWEQTAAGIAAVYRFSVPRSASHYQVNYACTSSDAFHDIPGYHGSLAIDPTSGFIFRITLEADWNNDDPISHVASVIEYGPVTIGDRQFICPLRSLAFMVEEANVCTPHVRNQKLPHPVTMLNRTNFSNYHRLGSTARMITDPAADPPSAPAKEPEK